MKKSVVFSALILLYSLCAFGQEEKISAGIGVEWNMNSRHYYAGGAAFSMEFHIPKYSSVGFTVSGNTNFSGITVIEPTLLLRAYIPGNGYKGFFVQVDLGTHIILENKDVTVLFEQGGRGGYRLLLGDYFYVEAYGRLGYPFVFGIGAMTGVRF